MDNENDCRAENGSLSPKPPLVDADAVDERDEGMQKYVSGDNAVRSDVQQGIQKYVDADAMDERDEGMQKYVSGDDATPSDAQQQLVSELVCEMSAEKSEEQIQGHSEIASGNVSDEPPIVPDEKEPYLCTCAVQALIEPSQVQEGFGTVEDPEQHLEVGETQNRSATGSGRQDALEGISNQVKVDNNEQERTENNALGDDASHKGAAESAKEVIVSRGQGLGMDTPAAEQDFDEALGNEPQLVPIYPTNEALSCVESCVERELGINEHLAVEQEPLEQSLDAAFSSSDLEMAADVNKKGDEAPPLKADKDITSTGSAEGEIAATFEVVDGDATTDGLREFNSENEPGLCVLKGMQPYDKESNATFNKQLENEGPSAGISPITALESTANGISNAMLETPVTAEAPMVNHVSEHMLENGDSLGKHSSRENEGNVECSYVEYSTAPVLGFGKVIDGITEDKSTTMASTEKGIVCYGMTAEDGKQTTSEPLLYNDSESKDESSKVSKLRMQTSEGNGSNIDAGNGKEIAGGTKGIPSSLDATSTSDSLVLQNGFIKDSKGDFEAKVITDGIADKESAQAFRNERSWEPSLSLVVPEQGDRAYEHMGQKDIDCTTGSVTVARRANWWGCCGMLELLLHKYE